MQTEGLRLSPWPRKWEKLDSEERKGFQEDWQLQFADPKTQRGVWLKLALLSSKNGFRKVVETWALLSHRKESKEMSQFAFKQSHDLRMLELPKEGGLLITGPSGSELGPQSFKGQVQSKGRTLVWDLNWKVMIDPLSILPEKLMRIGHSTGLFEAEEDLPSLHVLVSGRTKLDQEEHNWVDVPGTLTHSSGRSSWDSWSKASCSSFESSDFAFAAFSGKIKLPGLLSSLLEGAAAPQVHCFYFRYQNQDYFFNTLWESLRSKSLPTVRDWNFELVRGDLRFRGTLTGELRDFAGLTFEDAEGSILQASKSTLCAAEISVYRGGKLEKVFKSSSASYETVSGEKNPYVPSLV